MYKLEIFLLLHIVNM